MHLYLFTKQKYLKVCKSLRLSDVIIKNHKLMIQPNRLKDISF